MGIEMVSGIAPLLDTTKLILVNYRESSMFNNQPFDAVSKEKLVMVRTWIVVADGSRARLFSSNGGRNPIREIEGMVRPSVRLHEGDLSESGNGRTFNGDRRRSHGLASNKSIKKHVASQFAKQIATRLKNGLHKGAYNHLMLVAAPAMLGTMRETLSPQVSRKVLLELDKDLTRDPVDKIRSHLPAYLPTATL